MNRVMVADVVKTFVRDIWCGVWAVSNVVVKVVTGVLSPGLRRDSLGHLLLSRLALPTAAGSTSTSGTACQLVAVSPVVTAAAYLLGGTPSAGLQAWSGAPSRTSTA